MLVSMVSYSQRMWIEANYIIVEEVDGEIKSYSQPLSQYMEEVDHFKLYSDRQETFIPFASIANWTDEGGGVPYTEESMRTFLQTYTATIPVEAVQTFANRIIVTQQNKDQVFGDPIDSSKEYFIDGIIDMGTTQIVVPPTGIQLRGYSFDVSGLFSSEDNYIMFVSQTPVIGSGNVLGMDYAVEVTGTNSKVYELYDATGFSAVEFARINYNNCTSLGDFHNYRQGLETGTGRFGGTPNLTLHGAWLGGFAIRTSIVRSLSALMTGALFQEGTSFIMNSRFVTDMNCDLPANAALLDFQPSNFPNPGTLQLQGLELTRDGVYNAEDANLTPNIDRGDLASYWKANNGLSNTYVGGTATVISEELTNIVAGSTWYVAEGIFTGVGLQHMTVSAEGRIEHLGNTPREFELTGELLLESQANNDVSIRFQRWDASASSFINLDYTILSRQVNNFVGGRDTAIFNIQYGVILDQNDYIRLQVRNNNGNQDITLESGSYMRLQER